MKTTILTTAFLIACMAAGAQTLVKDINPGAGSGYPNNFVTLGNYTYFVGSDGQHGFELWKTDGTTNGTTMVKDINADGDGLAQDQDGLVYSTLTIMNNELYFFADDGGITGFELWKSDGTESGTVQVKDIYPGDTSSVDLGGQMIVFGNSVYFAAQNTYDNTQLWKSDGTANGTTLVKTIGTNSSNPSEFFAHGSIMYFVADSGFAGRTLWKTDGTEGGTVMLKDIDTVHYNEYVTNYTVFNNRVYFTAYETVHGSELWTTDGTKDGTHMVVDIAPGPFGSNPDFIVVFGNKMVFNAGTLAHGDELWMSDGTPEGTMEIKDIDTTHGAGSEPFVLTIMGDKIYFQANDGIHGTELWSSDGTADGTKLVKNINTTTTTYIGSYPSDLTAINGMLYFNADDSIHGREPYQSDGTAEGTVMLSDIRAGADGSYPQQFTQLKNLVLFEANDNVIGAELYRIGEPLGIAPVSAPVTFRVQPNPANEQVTVTANTDLIGATIQLMDITGNEISSGIFTTPTYRLNIAALPTGIYLVKMTGLKGEVQVQKVVKQ